MTSDVQFVNVTEQSGIGSYAWTPREKRPLTILGTIGNGAAFIARVEAETATLVQLETRAAIAVAV